MKIRAVGLTGLGFFLIDHCRIYFSSCTCVAACLAMYKGNVVLLILPIYTCCLYEVYRGRLLTHNEVHVTNTVYT